MHVDNDSPCDVDLLVACFVLQKQIEHINGNKENLIEPSARMTAIREKAKEEEASMFSNRLFVILDDHFSSSAL